MPTEHLVLIAGIALVSLLILFGVIVYSLRRGRSGGSDRLDRQITTYGPPANALKDSLDRLAQKERHEERAKEESPPPRSALGSAPPPPPMPAPARMLPPAPEPQTRDKSSASPVEMPVVDLLDSASEMDAELAVEGEADEAGFDEPVAAAPPDTDSTAEVQFSAYYPKEVIPDVWKPLTAYIYKAAFAEAVAQDAQTQLGEAFAGMRHVAKSAQQPLKEGELITATPHLSGFQFNPPSIQVGFYEDWHRLNFKLRAVDAPLNQAINGFLTFTVEGVIMADIPLAVFVGENESETVTVSPPQKPYQAIFCSYSHQDKKIVERVERAYKALGLDYLRDVYTLKSGQAWDDQLLKLIEQADIFQLFWSPSASESPYVRQEWEHALKIQQRSAYFIRPVYWHDPIPAVPEALAHIHFTYQPELSE